MISDNMFSKLSKIEEEKLFQRIEKQKYSSIEKYSVAVWKNIKCPGCGKPNDREDLKARNGKCIFCGFRIVSNLNSYVKKA